MASSNWVSILPPILALLLAIWSRKVVLSLAGGIWFGWTILAEWNPFAGLATAIDRTVAVLGEPGDAKVILFTLVMGSLIATLEASGGVRGFVDCLERNRWINSPRRAQLLASRNLDEMVVERCPVPEWATENLDSIYQRLRAWQQGKESPRSEAERKVIEGAPHPIGNDAHFMLYLLEAFDTDLYWWTITANRDEGVLRNLLTHEQILPGFNDSGAHLTNMAFYDTNLRGLRIVLPEGPLAVARHVRRLTAEPADFFDLDVGRIAENQQADLLLIDPEALAHYDGDARTTEIYRDEFDHQQLVNRSDGVVTGVWIRGLRAWNGDGFADELGRLPMGRCLLARSTAPARSPEKAPV